MSNGEHDLLQVGAVILGMTVLAEAVAARTLKIKRGGVEKNQAQFAEQVVAHGEQPLLDEINQVVREPMPRPLLVGELLAQPAAGAVEMVPIEIGDAVDDQTMAPHFSAARSEPRVEQPMQYGKEDTARSTSN